jgi:8-oxo-dGTP diphosphatase
VVSADSGSTAKVKGKGLPVKRAISAGGVVIRRRDDGEVEIALVGRSDRNLWALPKGMVERGEKPEEAALREVSEETGLAVRLLDKIGTVDYWFVDKAEGVRYFKTVYFYLMEATGGDVSQHDWEYDIARWVPAEEALSLLSYPNEVDIVRQALTMLGFWESTET